MDNLPITAVVVLYNTAYAESATLKSLLPQTDVRVVVCDNSTRPMGNEVLPNECPQATYLSMGGNVGLPKAYNAALDSLKGQDGIVCLFDDDTEVGEDYFSALRAAVEEHPDADIYLPTVYDALGLMSPCHLVGVKTSRVKAPEDLEEDKISGINSAMAIRLRVFENYRYDEGYFLDCVDHAFLRDMRSQGKKIAVFTADLFQNFSGADFYNTRSGRVRFRIFYKDFYRFCSDSFSHRVYGCVIIARRWCHVHAPQWVLRLYQRCRKREDVK